MPRVLAASAPTLILPRERGRKLRARTEPTGIAYPHRRPHRHSRSTPASFGIRTGTPAVPAQLRAGGLVLGFARRRLPHGTAGRSEGEIAMRRAILATGVILALGAATAAAETRARFVLDWAFQGVHGSFTLAEDNGHFAKEKLAVRIDRGYGSGDAIAKVAAGSYEFGLADIPTLISFNDKNPANKVVAVLVQYDRTETSIVALKKSGIRAPKDLAGKTVAAPAGTSARLLFPVFAAVNGFDAASVKWVTVKPDVKDSLLLRGEADAVTAFPSTTLMFLQSQGVAIADATVLRFAEHGLDLVGNGVIVSEKFAAAQPDTVKAFVRAAVRGMKDAVADPKKAVGSVKKRDNLLREDIELQRVAMLAESSILTANVKANGFSSLPPERLARMIGFVAKAMEIATPPKPAEVYREDFLPPSAERMP